MPEEDWMPPFGAPSIPPPPYHMTPESEYMYAFYDRPDEALERAVPDPLELVPEDGKPRVRMVVGDPVQPPHTHTPYHEGIVSVRVAFDGQVGWYLPYIWTNNDESMDAGRLYGWYKQYCDETPIEKHGNRIKGVLQRDGDLLYEMRFRSTSAPRQTLDTDPAERMAEYMEGPVYGVKKVPSPERGGKVLKQVVATELTDVEMHEVWAGQATVEFHPSGKYPHLHEFEPEGPVEAFFTRPEFMLPHGEVVWDRYE